MIAIALTVGLFAAVVLIPILVYTFLIFPNIDGVMQDIRWYNYDQDSKHYIFWLGFWTVMILSGLGGSKVRNRSMSS